MDSEHLNDKSAYQSVSASSQDKSSEETQIGRCSPFRSKSRVIYLQRARIFKLSKKKNTSCKASKQKHKNPNEKNVRVKWFCVCVFPRFGHDARGGHVFDRLRMCACE